MSRSLYINFRDDGFWAYDVPSSVFLKFLVDAANDRMAAGTEQWLSNAVCNWRVTAAISELSHYADDEWSQSQIDIVVELCRTTINAIRRGGDIPAYEIESWPILDEHRICTRGHDSVPCEPVARLGEAFVALLQNRLPKLPERHWWFFTLDENPDTIAMRTDM